MKGIALHVGRGTHREGLTVFPIWQEPTGGRAVAIADDHLVRVGELADPAVPFLQVTVVVTTPVLVLDGDVLTGGLQDRVAIGSTLLAGGTTTVINVRCVEQERWSGGRVHGWGPPRNRCRSQRFRSGRGVAAAGADNVATYGYRAGSSSAWWRR
ncbi:ARPP-1 family domain-containing protein [Nakamurella sp. GG22]